jgi:hypothetical protein
MPGRGRSTFNKRQKEISRQEKRREKAARKQQRKLEKQAGDPGILGDSTTPESPSPDSDESGSAVAPDSDISQEEWIDTENIKLTWARWRRSSAATGSTPSLFR